MKKLMKRKPVFPDFRWVDDFWGDNGKFFTSEMPALTTPAVNVVETPEAFTLDFGVPGMSKKDFDLKVENGLLILNAEKRTEMEDENEGYSRREFNYTSFSRSFWLPENVSTKDIKATYKDGILEVVLPKTKVDTKPKANRIEVN